MVQKHGQHLSKLQTYRDLETKMVKDPKDSTKLVLDTTHYTLPSEPYIYKAAKRADN